MPSGCEAGASRRFLEDTLGFGRDGDEAWEVRGDRRGSSYVYDRTSERGFGGAGTVHHVAWSSTMEDHERWREAVVQAGLRPTPVIDRFWFHSIYFREPSGVLFEIATLGPGFAVDEDADRLGEELRVPKMHAHLRDRLEQTLTPLVNPRTARRDKVTA